MYRFTFVTDKGSIPKDNERSKFIINEKKKTVVCVSYVKLKNLEETFGFDMGTYIVKRLREEHYVPKGYALYDSRAIQVVGIAKCDPTDIFDAVIGKRIAETRMRQRVYELMERINIYAHEYILMLRTELDKAIEKTNFLKYREINHCKELVWSTGIKPDNDEAS